MFTNARIKLTAWYLLIIMTVSGFFSMVVYRVITSEVDRLMRAQKVRLERRFLDDDLFPDLNNHNPPFTILDPELVSETKNRLVFILILINGGILLLSGGLGYILAGRTLKPIADMVDEQKQFISDASHELRTPLTSLKSAMEVGLRDKNLSLKEARKMIKENILEVDKLQLLSDGLLHLSQFKKPGGLNKFEKVNLGKIISDAVKKVEPMSKLKNIQILNGTRAIIIEGDREGLTNMVVILLDNAVKYSQRDKTIQINAHREKSYAVIKVADNGIGIDQKDIPHIFERFYRADTARTKTDAGGFGLGLPIAKRIAGMHRGKISVESRLGSGSIFTVSIPVKS